LTILEKHLTKLFLDAKTKVLPMIFYWWKGKKGTLNTNYNKYN